MDLLWLSIALSGVAALLAGWAALRPHRDPLVADALDDLRQDLAALRTALGDEMRHGREETGSQARQMREELAGTLVRLGDGLAGTMGRLGSGQTEKVEAVAAAVRGLAETNERRLAEMRRDGEDGGKKLRDEVGMQVRAFGELIGKTLDGSAAAQKERLEEVSVTIRRLIQTNGEAHEVLKGAVEGRLETMRTDNAAKLEEMRRTVDEKLQGTLEERLGEKFKLVSHHLEQVNRSVGEMQALATGVGDLKRVLTNVKTRGTWAEVSLGSLLEQVLTTEQFDRNVETVVNSNERVEYAVRLPGQEQGDSVWLPIDAKFPVEDYDRLVDASERGDGPAVEVALKALEARIRHEGQTICRKYVRPPATTDFAILYLPTEGLYAEVIRRPGLVDELQTRCRVIVAGPTTLLALLNSLRMGFRTLAIQKRSGEIATTLGAVRTEFAKYGEVLDRVQKKLNEASRSIDDVAVRRRAIDRKLAGFECETEAETAAVLGLAPPLLEAAE